MFLSATLPNALEFAQWVTSLHNHPCHVVYTDHRPTPLQHYAFPKGGRRLHRRPTNRASLDLIILLDYSKPSRRVRSPEAVAVVDAVVDAAVDAVVEEAAVDESGGRGGGRGGGPWRRKTDGGGGE